MIEVRWGECCVGVTKNAILARWHMQGRLVLANGESTVVASLAATGDVLVAGAEKGRGSKTAGSGVDVTSTTVIQRRNMVSGTASCNNAIVTGGTVTAVYPCVIEGYAGKGIKQVRAVT